MPWLAPSPRRSTRVPRAVMGLLGVAAMSLTASPAGADLYSYTDADGVIHFSNKPQGDGKYKLYLKTAKPTKSAGASIAVMPSDSSMERFTRYDAWIRQAGALYQIPEALIRAIIKCESDYDPRAVSPVGAQGLMQLMPETGLRMQVRDAFDPRENIFGGTRYLRVLANTFNGDLELTIAGYNAGEGAVARHGGIPPYAETQGYVTRVLTYYRRYRVTVDPAVASQNTP